jgi:putative spermidine/putrescine transport system permease protein
MTAGGTWRQGLRGLSLALLLVWLVLPLVPILVWSAARGWRFPDLLPQEWSGAAWSIALSPRSDVWEAMGQSAAIAAAATALSLLLGVPAGRALGGRSFRGRSAVELLVLAPIIVPSIATALGLHAVFLRLGLTNTATGVVIAHLIPTLPYVILVSAAVFASHDRAFEDQARTLGASGWQTLRHVTLPMVMPGIAAGALFAFLVSWSQYLLTLLIGGGRVVTLPLLLFSYASAGRNDLTGAIGVLYILPGIAVLLLGARHLTGRGAALTGAALP